MFVLTETSEAVVSEAGVVVAGSHSVVTSPPAGVLLCITVVSRSVLTGMLTSVNMKDKINNVQIKLAPSVDKGRSLIRI